jgi:hypothetical protein
LPYGSQIKQSDLRRDLQKISTMPEGAADGRFGVAIGYAVDRMRDLVRRAILARLCLAAEPDPVWPFSGSVSFDALIADDETRAGWRASWHDKLASPRNRGRGQPAARCHRLADAARAGRSSARPPGIRQRRLERR